MKNLSRIAALTVAILVAMSLANFQQVAAQDDMSDEYDDLAELEGLQSGVLRTFNIDYAALISGTASPINVDGSATPTPDDYLDIPDGLALFAAGVLQFETEDAATAAVEQARTEIVKDDEVTEFEIDGLEGPTIAFAFVEEDEHGSVTGTTILTQDGDLLVLVQSVGINFDSEELASGFVIDVFEADPGDSDAEFHEDGTSSGGLWDKLPSASDEAFASLPMVVDVEITPEQDS